MDVGEPVDALGYDRFAVVPYSAGGPYALACAALLGERVTRAGLVATDATRVARARRGRSRRNERTSARAVARALSFQLEEIAVEVLLWHGSLDVIAPAAGSAYLASRVPGSRLELWPGDGHIGIARHWDEIVEAVIGDGDPP